MYLRARAFRYNFLRRSYFIICLDAQLRHFAEQFRELFTKPQFKYLVTVLLGLMLQDRPDARVHNEQQRHQNCSTKIPHCQRLSVGNGIWLS